MRQDRVSGHEVTLGTVDRLAAAESLLVCVDFDGTICELGPDAYAVTPHPDAIAALEELALLPNTDVAVLSGRHLAGLKTVCPLADPVILVGSHGAEPTEGGPQLTTAQHDFLEHIEAELKAIAAGNEPAFVEVKPYQRVLHVAELAETDPERAAALLAEAEALADTLPVTSPESTVTPGHNVVEFSALTTSKGTWLAAQKTTYAATLFAGDDVTDETALRVLEAGENGPDVGIKIGRPAGDNPGAPTETAAGYRLPGVDAFADYLVTLAAARRSALGGTGSAEAPVETGL